MGDCRPPPVWVLDDGTVLHDQGCITQTCIGRFLSILSCPKGIHGDGNAELDMVGDAIRAVDRWGNLIDMNRARFALGWKAEPVAKGALADLREQKLTD